MTNTVDFVCNNSQFMLNVILGRNRYRLNDWCHYQVQVTFQQLPHAGINYNVNIISGE